MSTLAALCGELETFAGEHWEQHPLLHRNVELADLLTLADVDALICGGVLPAPQHVRVANVDGARRDWVRFVSALSPDVGPVGLADRERLLTAFAGGDTIVVRDVRNLVPRVDAFAHALELEVGHPVTVNAYLTPPGEQGLPPHYDLHHAFIVQTHGTKRWSVWPQQVELPTRGYGPDRFGRSGDPWEVELSPGDVLYIPRGHPHSGATTGDASLHATIAVRQVTVVDALSSLFAELIELPRFRRALPLGYRNRPDALRSALRRALDDVASMLDEHAVELACDLVTGAPPVRRTAPGALEALTDALVAGASVATTAGPDVSPSTVAPT